METNRNTHSSSGRQKESAHPDKQTTTPRQVRDMSQRQFADAVLRHGFQSVGFMGYYELGIEGHRISVSVWNAGTNRRARLAYLLSERDRYIKEIAKESAA